MCIRDRSNSSGTYMKKIKNTNKKIKIKKNVKKLSKEIGGQKGPEPTRYGDWEKNGRVTDF